MKYFFISCLLFLASFAFAQQPLVLQVRGTALAGQPALGLEGELLPRISWNGIAGIRLKDWDLDGGSWFRDLDPSMGYHLIGGLRFYNVPAESHKARLFAMPMGQLITTRFRLEDYRRASWSGGLALGGQLLPGKGIVRIEAQMAVGYRSERSWSATFPDQFRKSLFLGVDAALCMRLR